MSKWTEEQSLAINKDNESIIVSAGAGSGKTAVLTERVIRKLRDGISINNLLVLTFTNAAASEMKDRIRSSIKKENMTEQLDYLDSSYITTFDSFARSIVSKYYYLLSISDKFDIVDNSVLSIIKKKYIDEIFENMYGDTNFNNLINHFCDKQDDNLKKEILSINDKLDLRFNKREYLDNYINNYYNDTYLNNILNEYYKIVISEKNKLKDILTNIRLSDENNNYEKIMEVIEPMLESDDYQSIKDNSTIELPRLSKATDELKKAKEELKKQLKVITDLTNYSLEELKDNLGSTKDDVEIIIKIIKELDNKLNKYKKDNSVYTFNDIALMAINIVNNNEDVREYLKNYFNEIMVDEYQDTSDLQETFISLIANNNVYMVGDIKQSIYRFRNANPEIFRKKYNSYTKHEGGYKIDLLRNFRSREEVLNNINNIFDYIMDENIGNAAYQESHRMIFGNNMYDLKAKEQSYDLDILSYNKDDNYKKYNNDEIEAFIIGNDIINKINSHYKIIDKDTSVLRDFKYDDACIIMDRGSSFDTYKKIFEYLSIPLITWADNELNESDTISIIKNIISLIIKIKENKYDKEFRYYYVSISRSYLFNYNDNDIFNTFIDNSLYDNDIFMKAKDISKDIDIIDNSTLLDSIIDKFNIYEKCITVGDIEKTIIELDNLNSLFKSLSSLGYTPYNLIEYFKDSTNEKVKYSLNTKVPGNVNLMNIHKSKGLEFSVCYFSGFAKKFNESDIKDNFVVDNKYGIIIPFYNKGIGDTILKDLFVNKYKEEDISEKIRLLYVGLTRAKEKMIIVAPLTDKEVILNNIVDDNIRMKYRSFLDIINSVKPKLEEYIKDINLDSINISKEYNNIKSYNYKETIADSNDKIDNRIINIDYKELGESHYSKVTSKLNTLEEINNMELGTYIHYLFETTDFKNANITGKYKDLVMNFIKKIDTNCDIYKEYEFIYKIDNDLKHGVIDLMLVYSDHVDIIDYKLKNTIDDNYKKQVQGYKDYIYSILNKDINTYLYSILNNELIKINTR